MQKQNYKGTHSCPSTSLCTKCMFGGVILVILMIAGCVSGLSGPLQYVCRRLVPRAASSSTQVNAAIPKSQHLFSVAPMMEYTDRHQRHLQRLLSKDTVLYTEMVTTNAIIRSGDALRFLQANMEVEDPLVLQLGGSDPVQMREASKAAHEYGYKEININIGCPSEKVSGAGCFGAVLFLNPDLVTELALAVGEGTGKPATIKCRIGVDSKSSYEDLCAFIRQVSEVGKVEHFIIHARIAVLGAKFSPHDNRTIPPLKYDIVYQLVRDFPLLQFSLNGGVDSVENVQSMLQQQPRLHGVMVGRAVVSNPFAWSAVDSLIYNKSDPGLTRLEVLHKYAEYTANEERQNGQRFTRALVKPALNLFHGVYNGKLFRQRIDKCLTQKLCATDTLLRAAECFNEEPIAVSNTIQCSNDAAVENVPALERVLMQ